MAQQTNIFEAFVGGNPTNLSNMFASTGIGEQIEVTVTLRSAGNVRLSSKDAGGVVGVTLSVDDPVSFRLGEAQRAWIVTDDATNRLRVDIIIQPPSMPKEELQALQSMVTAMTPQTATPYCPPKTKKRSGRSSDDE